jgi:hypothetical protein
MGANTNSRLSPMAHAHRLARIVDVHFQFDAVEDGPCDHDRGILIEHDQNELAILDCATAVTFRGLITSRSIVSEEYRKSVILKRRDVRVVEGARLERDSGRAC